MFKKENQSYLIHDGDLEHIYSWVPSFLRATDPVPVYCSKIDGNSYSTFRKVMTQFSGCPVLLLIRDTSMSIFGAYFENEVDFYSQKFEMNSDNFVFKLKPKPCCFKNRSNTNFFYFFCDFENVIIGGGGDGPALTLDNELKEGRSCRSGTFDNAPLHHVWSFGAFVRGKSDSFVIDCVEIVLLS